MKTKIKSSHKWGTNYNMHKSEYVNENFMGDIEETCKQKIVNEERKGSERKK